METMYNTSPVFAGRALKRPEILAPGGSIESIEAAVTYGADAVYLGVGNLNARSRAGNLREDQLAGVVRYCHEGGTRVHVTLNIPVTALNAAETARVLALCHQAGADAVIVRDPLIMKTAARLIPDLPIHASTQAGVHSVETARRMADLGCSRVILARECSRREIAEIRAALPETEIEVFVFGAMCFGISGLCMMGHAVSGRSGNYGSCCQSCRLPYFDQEKKPVGYAFSMKDLDLVPHVAELVSLGVDSFKIEGRLKTPSWVACVTKWLKTAVDRPFPGLTATEYDQFNREVSVMYSRPRTDAYFQGRTDASELLSVDHQTHMGLDAGPFKVRRDYSGTSVAFDTPVDINIRDGLLLKLADADAPEGVSFVPVGIRALIDGRGRNAIRIAQGHEIRVPLPDEIDGTAIRGVAIHSADSVRARYRKVERHVPASVLDSEPPVPEWRQVTVQADMISATMEIGRHTGTATAGIASEKATGPGLDPEKLSKYFGSADYSIAPELFVNPTILKSARRELASAFEIGRLEALSKLAATIQDSLVSMSGDFQPTDDELMAGGLAALSRVTGLPTGRVFTSAGDGFEIAPTGNHTKILKISDDR